MVTRIFIVLGALAAVLAACSPAGGIVPVTGGMQITNPNPTQFGDGALVRDTVQIVRTELSPVANATGQVIFKILYFTPTPCHQFRLSVEQPAAGNQINVTAYSLMKANQVCTLMRLATPMEADVLLTHMQKGHYTIYLNGAKAQEFDV